MFSDQSCTGSNQLHTDVPGDICLQSHAFCPGASLPMLSLGCYEKVPECVIGMDIVRSWKNPVVSSLTSRIKACYDRNDRKDSVEALVTVFLPQFSG